MGIFSPRGAASEPLVKRFRKEVRRKMFSFEQLAYGTMKALAHDAPERAAYYEKAAAETSLSAQDRATIDSVLASLGKGE